jgi:hypothetical protein
MKIAQETDFIIVFMISHVHNIYDIIYDITFKNIIHDIMHDIIYEDTLYHV